MTTGIVFQEDGQAMTTSIIVAREFRKDHRNVLRDIRALIEGGRLKNEQTPMFIEAEYINEQNGQLYPMYNITRDGFTLLAMGFTGERALEFKMKFLKAFNAMGQMLSSDEYILMRSQQIMKRLNDQLTQKVQMLEGQNTMLEEENKILAPKADYTDKVLQANGTYTISEMAKELNFTGWKSFVDELKRMGIMYKHQGGRYMLYAEYSGKHYTTTRTNTYTRIENGIEKVCTNVITVWTEEGRRFLHEKFNVEMNPVEITIFPIS